MNCPVTQIMEIGDEPVDMMVGFSHSTRVQRRSHIRKAAGASAFSARAWIRARSGASTAIATR